MQPLHHQVNGRSHTGAGSHTRRATISIDIQQRDLRFMRAANQVLGKYDISAGTPDSEGRLHFSIQGTNPQKQQVHYQVEVSPDWSAPPSCSCPDAKKRARQFNGGYCKHLIAVLMREEDLQYQLLDLLL